MQEKTGDTTSISSIVEVGELYELLLMINKSDPQKKYEMEKRSVHTPFQRVQKKAIYFTPNSLNSCKIVMWITCQSSNLMYKFSIYYMSLIKI